MISHLRFSSNEVASYVKQLPFRPLLFCVMDSIIIHFGIQKYELSLTIYIGLPHMYHLSVLLPKQHQIPLIVSRRISIPNVSPNLTDPHI